jgi:hypothetical protein
MPEANAPRVKPGVRHQMHFPLTSPLFPKHIWALLAVYFVATLMHFAHNAEYIAIYPNMPAWLTREKVYVAWLAVSSVGLAGLIVSKFGLRTLGALFVGAYGAFGLDALGHYTLALCSEHTLAANFTIWFEAIAGVMLALASALLIGRSIARVRTGGVL